MPTRDRDTDERAVALRLAGLTAGALFIALWPDPPTRLTITVLALLASYLAGLWMATSDAEWAQKTRERISASLKSPGPARQEPDKATAPSAARWVVRRAAWLRVLGVAAAALALVVLPFSYGAFLAVVVLLLLYLAAIDVAVNSTR